LPVDARRELATAIKEPPGRRHLKRIGCGRTQLCVAVKVLLTLHRADRQRRLIAPPVDHHLVPQEQPRQAVRRAEVLGNLGRQPEQAIARRRQARRRQHRGAVDGVNGGLGGADLDEARARNNA